MNIDKDLFKNFTQLLFRYRMYVGEESAMGIKQENIINLLDIAAGSVATSKHFDFPKSQNVAIDSDGIPLIADEKTRQLILEEKKRLLEPIDALFNTSN